MSLGSSPTSVYYNQGPFPSGACNMHAWFHPTTKLLARSTKTSSCALRSGSFGAKWQGKVWQHDLGHKWTRIFHNFFRSIEVLHHRASRGLKTETGARQAQRVSKEISFEVGSAMPFHVALLLNEDHKKNIQWQCVFSWHYVIMGECWGWQYRTWGILALRVDDVQPTFWSWRNCFPDHAASIESWFTGKTQLHLGESEEMSHAAMFRMEAGATNTSVKL